MARNSRIIESSGCIRDRQTRRQGFILEDDGGFIGVFDSGVGGISVLREMVQELPMERFVYFGDSAHAPYGDKTSEEVLGYASEIVREFFEEGAKAIVIACNTATSAAAQTLRDEYPDIPILGVEPALKPATRAAEHEDILVLATEITIDLDKFHRLAREYGTDSNVIAVPCVGLADLIERGITEGDEIEDLLEDLIGEYRGRVDSVVLGCTHYAFVRDAIRARIGDVPMYDGAKGTARHLRRRLEEAGLLRKEGEGGVEFRSSLSDPEELELYESFFRKG